ncbi:MAG: hypothetical protein COA78_18975 [Blastopirellula sp.]|nr:MAG: hypothetical protein COA78_18975 [Blastopirellula sp.]
MMNKRNFILIGLSLIISGSPVLAQNKDKNNKDRLPAIPQEIKQYKKNNRDRITDLHNNKDALVIKYFEEYLGIHEHDLEAYYGLTLAYARIGKIDNEKQHEITLHKSQLSH